MMRKTLRCAATLLLLTPLACGGADARPTAAPAPDTPPPPVVEVQAPSAPGRVAEVQTETVARPAECEDWCIVADGAHAVDEDAAQKVADSLAGTFDGLRACMRQAGMTRSYSPMVTVRFDARGQESFIGVDTAGYEPAEPCVTNTVLGSALSVSVAGAAVVRCSETCARKKRRHGH